MIPDQDIGGFFRENKELLKRYLDARLELFRLQGVQLLSKGLGIFVWLIVIAFTVFFILLFLGMLLAFWLAARTGSTVLGFGVAAGLFLVLLIILVSFRRQLFQAPVSRIIIREILNEREGEQ